MVRFDCIERPLRQLFAKYGRFLSHHPLPFIIIPVIVALGLSSGLGFLKRYSEMEYLYTRRDSRVRKATEYIEVHFPQKVVDNYLRITVVPKSSDASNVWTESIMEEVIELDKYIQRFEVKNSSSGDIITFNDVCAKEENSGDCIQHPLLELINYDASYLRFQNISFPYQSIPVSQYSEPVQLFLPTFLGRVNVSDANHITSAEAMWLWYSSEKDHPSSLLWEETVRDTMLEEEIYKEGRFQYISLTIQSTNSYDEEIRKVGDTAMPLFAVTFSTLFIFSILVCLSLDWVMAKPWLGVAGIVSALLAIASGFGILLFFMPFIDLVAIVPFLAIGVGMDDMFVMIAAWRTTSPHLSLEDRMSAAMADAAVSITVTTMTNLVAIGVGAISDIVSVRFFCIFAATTIFLDFVFQITFFAGCMVYSGRREAAQKHALTCREALPQPLARDRSRCFQWWCTGGPLPGEENQELWAMKFLYNHYGRFITALPTKICVILFYFLYIGMGIYGCLNIQEGFEMYKTVQDSSYLHKDILYTDTYFRDFNEEATVVVHDRLMFWMQEDRDKIDSAFTPFEESDYFHERNVSRIWTRDFDRYVTKRRISVTQTNFIAVLDAFLMEPRYAMYKYDIEFNANRTDILSTKYTLYPRNLHTPESKMHVVKKAWEIEDESELDMETTNVYFVIYEAWTLVLPTTLQNFGIAMVAVLVLCLMLIPNPLCSLYVALSIISVGVGVIGYMTFWNVNLEFASMINIIMGIGFAVDFTAHITYSFCVIPGKKRDERVRQALHDLGVPIIQGCVSTILALLVMCNSEAYVFRVFFKVFFLTMVFGALHGLVFIPVILSLIGPPEMKKHTEKDEDRKKLYDSPFVWPSVGTPKPVDIPKTGFRNFSPKINRDIKPSQHVDGIRYLMQYNPAIHQYATVIAPTPQPGFFMQQPLQIYGNQFTWKEAQTPANVQRSPYSYGAVFSVDGQSRHVVPVVPNYRRNTNKPLPKADADFILY